MSICTKYNRIIRGFGGYCTTDFRGIVGKGDCWKFGSGRYKGVFIHGGAESGGEICKKESRKSFRRKRNVSDRREVLIHIGRGGGFSLGLDRCFAYRTTEYIFDGKTARHEIQGDCHSTEYFD